MRASTHRGERNHRNSEKIRFLQLCAFPPNLGFAFLLSLTFILSTKHQLSPSNSRRSQASWCDGPSREDTSIPCGPNLTQIRDLVSCHKAGHRHNRFPPGHGSGCPTSLETCFRSDFSALRGKREREREIQPWKTF